MEKAQLTDEQLEKIAGGNVPNVSPVELKECEEKYPEGTLYSFVEPRTMASTMCSIEDFKKQVPEEERESWLLLGPAYVPAS